MRKPESIQRGQTRRARQCSASDAASLGLEHEALAAAYMAKPGPSVCITQGKPACATGARGPTIGVGLHADGRNGVREIRNDRVGDADAGASRALLERGHSAILDTAVTGPTACGAILENQRIVIRRRVQDGSGAPRILRQEHAPLEFILGSHWVPKAYRCVYKAPAFSSERQRALIVSERHVCCELKQTLRVALPSSLTSSTTQPPARKVVCASTSAARLAYA